jgi:hypothetical protein
VTRNGQEVLDVFVTEITYIICISVISVISDLNVTSEIMCVKCNNVYNNVIRVLFYNYIKAKVKCVIRVL